MCARFESDFIDISENVQDFYRNYWSIHPRYNLIFSPNLPINNTEYASYLEKMNIMTKADIVEKVYEVTGFLRNGFFEPLEQVFEVLKNTLETIIRSRSLVLELCRKGL